MLGDIKSDSRATSSRNHGREFVGIAGDMTPEFARSALSADARVKITVAAS
jgi:hypothetical protein